MSSESKVAEEIQATSRNLDQVLIDQMMDVENETPLMMRLSRVNIDKQALKDIIGNATFEEDLYEHCRGQILLPAMAKILNSLVAKAASGSIQATRTYLELIKKLNSKIDVNVSILQYQGLSDPELDRRLISELSRAGVLVEDEGGEVVDAEIVDG